MANQKLTKRVVEAAEPRPSRYTIFDTVIPGFGLRVFPTGRKSWVLDYRPGEGGRATDKKRLTIGSVDDLTPDAARKEAEKLRATVIKGGDPQGAKGAARAAPTVEKLAADWLSDHVALKRAASTHAYYKDLLDRIILPELGKMKAKDLHSGDVSKLHKKLRDRPFLANRVLAVIGAMYNFGEGVAKMVPKGTNPAVDVEKFEEEGRERLLTPDELTRLGAALRDAETVGLPWRLKDDAEIKHRPKGELRTVIAPSAIAAIRLLLFTGCRLREILHLKWSDIDAERGVLVLTQHKTARRTGKKVVVLNAPAIEVLAGIERVGIYVIAGDTAGQKDEKPRSDLKRPWSLVTAAAGLDDLRIHDLRHNFASFGAGGGMGLPIIGKLLGHAQAVTTQRYAHLADDPLRKASNTIGSALAAALGEPVRGDAGEDDDNVVPLKRGA